MAKVNAIKSLPSLSSCDAHDRMRCRKEVLNPCLPMRGALQSSESLMCLNPACGARVAPERRSLSALAQREALGLEDANLRACHCFFRAAALAFFGKRETVQSLVYPGRKSHSIEKATRTSVHGHPRQHTLFANAASACHIL